MSWSRDEVMVLLEEYRKHPNLYNCKSANYKNRNVRKKSLDAIHAVLREIKPSVTTQDIQLKFQALKQNATKEKKKFLESHRSGTGIDKVIEPSLWYFNAISFVFDDSELEHCLAVNSFDLLSDQKPMYHSKFFKYFKADENATHSFSEELAPGDMDPIGLVVDNTRQPFSVNSHLKSSSSSLSSSQEPKRKKRNRKDGYVEALGAVTKTLQSISKSLNEPKVTQNNMSQNKSFGDYVVSKLDKIDNEEIMDEAEVEIINILNKALKKCRESDK